MIRVHLIEADGRRRTVEDRPGRSLMRTAVDAGVDGIAADCGGCLTCATCHVIIDGAWAERVEKAHSVVDEINRVADSEGHSPIVFITLVNDEIRDIVTDAGCRPGARHVQGLRRAA